MTDLGPTRTNRSDEDFHPEPVMVSLTAQEIGAMYAARTTPDKFAQEILLRMRAAGAPVEGTEGSLTLAHGVLTRMKSHPSGRKDLFGYLWLDSESWHRIQTYGEETGLNAYEGVAN